MPTDLLILLGAAISVAFVHTLSGPDHYLPFVAMARSGNWSRKRALVITALCGLGHVSSSLALAAAGVLLFRGADHFMGLESLRSGMAAWGLIAFGLIYALWGLRRARRSHTHAHHHIHADGSAHVHEHSHEHGHVHRHAGSGITPWALFVIFILGPCEPLVPMLIYASAEAGNAAALLVAAAFALVTVVTMLVIVTLLLGGLQRLSMPRLERYEHALAGVAVMATGIGIRFLGL